MKKIKMPKFEVTLSVAEVEEINSLIERDTEKLMIMIDILGKKHGTCPVCGSVSLDNDNFCSKCGQRLKYDPDTIPLDSPEFGKE